MLFAIVAITGIIPVIGNVLVTVTAGVNVEQPSDKWPATGPCGTVIAGCKTSPLMCMISWDGRGPYHVERQARAIHEGSGIWQNHSICHQRFDNINSRILLVDFD